MKICAINSCLADAFRELGHDVLDLRPKPGLVSLARLLEGKNFRPDLVFQQETLGKRILLSDLHRAPGIKVFWSVDTHLNLWWHGPYGQAFDLVLSTQDHLVEPLRAMGGAAAGHLPWFGAQHPFTPFAERRRDMVFLGRVSPHRQTRIWMLEFLGSRFELEHRQDVPCHEMIAASAAGRLAPNESIMGELNFRLFEAASAGCLVLNPAVDGDVSLLFEPGREVAVYREALELEALARRFLDRPDEAEAMGRAARDRVIREHLPCHRAAAVMAAAAAMTPRPRDARRQASWLRGVFLAWNAGLAPASVAAVRGLLAQRADDPDILAMLVRLTATTAERSRTAAALKPLMEAAGPAPSLELDLAASMAALRIGWMDAARRFFERRAGLGQGRGPGDAKGLLLAWADTLAAAGLILRSGFPFDRDIHLPATAMECLFLAGDKDAVDRSVAGRMRRLTQGLKGMELYHISALSAWTMHNPDDWPAGLELGLANLRAFRRDQGLQELALALDKARQAGQEDEFMSRVAARDGSGLVRAALAAPS